MPHHQGSCHCGAVQFSVDIDLSNPITCNCSMCKRAGTILAFAPEPTFELQSGNDSLTDYQFNNKVIHHYFCSTCGIKPFGIKPFGKGVAPDGSTVVAVNVRCLDGIDLDSLECQHYDGASL